MSSIVNVPFSKGYVSTGTGARDASDLDLGELVSAQSAYYRKNDPNQIWKMPGRSLFGSAGSSGIKGMAICQFDEGGTDRLLASISTKIVAATPGATGTFADLVTGLNASATRFTACHQDDRWYLGNGYDANRCLRQDGAIRLMSMQQPATAPTCSPSSGTLVVSRPTATAGDFVEALGFSAYDAYESTYAYGEMNAAGNVASLVQTWSGFASNTDAHRQLSVLFKTTFVSGSSDSQSSLVLEYSEDGGSVWYELYNRRFYGAVTTNQTVTTPITANSSLVHIRATITAPGISSLPTHPTLASDTIARLYDIKIQGGGVAANFSTTDGIYYATAEYNADDDLLSPPSEFSEKVTLATQNLVTITRSATANPAATHWRVYRIGDGVAKTKDNLGQVSKDIDIAVSTWTDQFEVEVTEQALPIIPLVIIGDTLYNRDDPAPPFVNMISWKGSICGISRTERRAWFYSEAGRPESFPPIYKVVSFPLEEHDGLVGQMPVGETMVLLCGGAALAVDDTPRATDGQFNAATARPIKGHPGCVGDYAYTTFSVAGEPRGAWVSPYGVYVTNGTVCACISTDLEWESEVNPSYLSNAVLRWDAKNLIIWFEFDKDGDGLNDHEMPFHMAQAHSKGESRPKLGQPTPKATSCMASALLGTTHYRFSGHPSNGGVYVEESGYQDAATGENVEMVVKTGQVGHDKVDLAVVKVTVNHSDFGAGETGELTATFYRDTANSQNSRVQSIRLDGNRGTTVGMGRAGELVDFEMTYSGTGSGGLGGVQAEVDGQGRSGSAQRWVASSATP